jgi:FdhE protein
MNLKLIDMVIGQYSGVLEQAEVARLEFFRSLWAALNEATGDVPSSPLPDSSVLEAAWAAGKPAYEVAPVQIDGAQLALTCERLVSVVKESGLYPADLVDELSQINWNDLFVEGVTCNLAGKAPAEWLQCLKARLESGDKNTKSAGVAVLLARLALGAQLEGSAKEIANIQAKFPRAESMSCTCPVCGSAPALAHVGADTSSAGRGRGLVCTQCGTMWEFERVRCPECGTRNQAHLHYVSLEGDDAHRLYTCDECGSYIRTVFTDDSLVPVSYEVEDVVMAKLDALACSGALSK